HPHLHLPLRRLSSACRRRRRPPRNPHRPGSSNWLSVSSPPTWHSDPSSARPRRIGERFCVGFGDLKCWGSIVAVAFVVDRTRSLPAGQTSRNPSPDSSLRPRRSISPVHHHCRPLLFFSAVDDFLIADDV